MDPQILTCGLERCYVKGRRIACSYRLASGEMESFDGGGGGHGCGCCRGCRSKKVVVSQLSSDIMVVSLIHPSSGMMFIHSSIYSSTLSLDPLIDAFIQSVATCLG